MNVQLIVKNCCVVLLSLVAIVLLNRIINRASTHIVQHNYLAVLEEKVTGTDASTAEKSMAEQQKTSQKQALFLLTCFATFLLLLALFVPFPSLLKKGLCVQAALYFSAHLRLLSGVAPLVTFAIIAQIGVALATLYILYHHHTKQKSCNIDRPTCAPEVFRAKKPHLVVSAVLLVLFAAATPLALTTLTATITQLLTILNNINKKAYTPPAQTDVYQLETQELTKTDTGKKNLHLFIFVLWIMLMLAFVTFFSVPLLLHMGIWIEALFYLLFTNFLRGYDSSLVLLVPLFVVCLFGGITLYQLQRKKLFFNPGPIK